MYESVSMCGYLVLAEQREVVELLGDVGVVAPEHGLADAERALAQRLRLAVLA